MLSTIIMTRNEERNIGRMLNSILEQKFNDHEIIIVDANSKDRTREVIARYSTRLPIQIVNGIGRGIGPDRNLGGQHARGTVLVFTEGDCFFRPGLFHHLADLFASDPSLVSWSSCAFPYHSPWYVTLTYKFYDVARYVLTRLRLGFSISGAIIVVRKAIYDQIGGFPDSKDMNDDGVLGRKIYDVCKRRGRYVFSIDPQYAVIRRMTRFDQGYFQALDHYLYVITNYIPFLRPLLQNKMIVNGRTFQREE